jgi:hypothetical protein
LFLNGRQSQGPDFRQFEAGMEPGAVRTEQDLFRPAAFDGPRQDIEKTHPGTVCMDVGTGFQPLQKGSLSPPVFREARQMGNDEAHVGIIPRQPVHHVQLVFHVAQHRQGERPGNLANLPADPGINGGGF